MKKFIKNIHFRIKHRTCKIALNANISMNSTIGRYVKILPNAKIGSTSIQSFTYIGENSEFTYTEIGSFCSIGSEVTCGLGIHPQHFVSTYPGFYSDKAMGAYFFGVNHSIEEHKSCKIGSDVWIGNRSIILGGINIGIGAIIAAGAVVTKDVPPYSIVAGVPAKIIKYRFDDELINSLLKSEWWKLPIAQIKHLAQYMNEPKLFLEKLNNEINK